MSSGAEGILGLRSHLEPAEAATIDEEELEPTAWRVFVKPFDCVRLTAGIAADMAIERCCRWSENDVHFAAVGIPAGATGLCELFGRGSDACEEFFAEFVDRRRGIWVAAAPEAVPQFASLSGPRIAKRVYFAGVADEFNEAEYLVEVCDHPLIGNGDDDGCSNQFRSLPGGCRFEKQFAERQ